VPTNPLGSGKVSTDHIEEVMKSVAAKDKGLAPRTQGHVYAAMRAMFKRAIPKLIPTNPCAIPTEDLPKKKDKDPECA
jgi:hypothetical protein